MTENQRLRRAILELIQDMPLNKAIKILATYDIKLKIRIEDD